MKKYIIDLENDENDDFGFDNVGKISVFNEEGNEISNSSRVMIMLSQNALLGLGTELIRLAKSYREGMHFHIYPSEKGSIVETLGIYLTNDSCEAIINCCEFGQIDEIVEKQSKN